MSETVRHWKRGYQHDHKAATLRGALTVALRCAGKTVTDESVTVLMVSLAEFGQITDEDLVYRRIGK